MALFERILVPVDESQTAAGALAFAAPLSKRFGSQLLIATAVDHAAIIGAAATPDGAYLSVQNVLDECDAAAKSLLQEAASQANAAGARATTALLDGRAAGAIVTCARAGSVDAIVMGRHGTKGLERFFLGSTAEGVLRMSDVPTFVIRSQRVATFERILVAVDESGPADAAVRLAGQLATASGAAITCCNVIETDDLLDKAGTYGYDPTPLLEEMRRTAQSLVEKKLQQLRAGGIVANAKVAEGQAVAALLQAATETKAGLIAIGTHGRGGLRRLFLGSVAAHLVRQSDVPVLVVPAPRDIIAS